MHEGSRLAGVALAAVLAAAPLPAQVPLPPRRGLENLAQDLVKAGWPDEAEQVVRVLEELGHEPGAVGALRANMAKVKPPKTQGAPDKLAGEVKKAAAALAAALPGAGDAQATLARAVLRLDDTVTAAHTTLAQRLVDGVWLDDSSAACLERRAVIQDNLAHARRLAIEPDVGTSKHPMFRDLNGADGCEVRCDLLVMHSEWPPDKAARVVRTALRALAFTGTLTGGKLGPGWLRRW